MTLPAGESVSTREARMTDFRLLRHGGFYHAVARYGENVWTTFTYAGLHATERVLRRKEQHRFWGVDCYSSKEGRYLRIGNRAFYEDPDQEVEPSGQASMASRGRLGQGVGPQHPERQHAHDSSAPRTASALRQWSCAPPGTWYPTHRAIRQRGQAGVSPDCG